MKRGQYDEIVMSSLDADMRQNVAALVKAAGEASRVDEHGSWAFGADFDSKGRGAALNWDLYAIGNDMHDGRLLIVIQIRQWVKHSRRGFAHVRKSYYLVGTNEDGSAFAHPVSANVVRQAINRDADPILACQSWIFGGDYGRMIRHGDLALIPLSRTPAAPLSEATELTLADSHLLTAKSIRQNGHLYACNPTLIHLPGTHGTVSAPGWCRVVIGQRGRFWNFAAPTAD